ncbi:MAG TPA: hypothetical protein VF476_08710 [Chitinophagaceae bacterium]
MRTSFLVIALLFSLFASAQEERDTTLPRCPVFITDTLTSNNFFLEHQPSTVRVSRSKGDLIIAIQQRDQFFTMFFKDKRLKDKEKYKIGVGSSKKFDLEAKYSFRSGGAGKASYVNLSSGTVEATFDEAKDLWRIKVNGMLANLVERNVTYYRVKADFYIR